MNPFVFSCMAPHGMEIIPELEGALPDRMKKTRDSMVVLGKKMNDAQPDTIMILTPHGTRISKQFCIVDSERMAGIAEENGSTYEMIRLVDRELAKAITDSAHQNKLPAASINFGTSAGPLSTLPLDWGAIVPLAFMPEVPIVVITPTRELSFEEHIKFGRVIRGVVESSRKRVGLIASCDWAHAHDESGPYGFDPAAKELDEKVVELIQTNQLEKLVEFDPAFIEAAKPDGIWQTLILAGAIPPEERKVDFLSYEAPTYFGLICAGF